MTYTKDERAEDMEQERIESDYLLESSHKKEFLIHEENEGFNLSEKGRNSNILLENKPVIMYMEYDVKEFIRLLKENSEDKEISFSIGKNGRQLRWIKISEEEIDKLAGEKLK